MTPVKSSNIAAIGHDPKSNSLIVHFKNGTKYSYDGVQAEHFSKLLNAESVGKHFHEHIRGGGYKASKVE